MACQQATTFESKRRSTTISVSLDATQRKAEMPKITIIRVDEKGVLRYHAGRAYGANCQLIQEQGLQSLMKFLLLYILELNAGEHYKTTTELISSTLIVLQFDYQKSRDAALSWTMNGHHFCGSAYFAWSS